jgi:shikimate kinase
VNHDERRHLILVGLMAVGKTTVGGLCALRLGRPFVDTDDLVELLSGRQVQELFAGGEAEFRSVERAAVADACASPTPLVIACGGGAVVDAGNRALLRRSGVVLWLRADADTLAERAGADGTHRPLLAGGAPVAVLAALAEARDAAYRGVADATVDAGDRTADEVADAVLEEYARCAA